MPHPRRQKSLGPNSSPRCRKGAMYSRFLFFFPRSPTFETSKRKQTSGAAFLFLSRFRLYWETVYRMAQVRKQKSAPPSTSGLKNPIVTTYATRHSRAPLTFLTGSFLLYVFTLPRPDILESQPPPPLCLSDSLFPSLFNSFPLPTFKRDATRPKASSGMRQAAGPIQCSRNSCAESRCTQQIPDSRALLHHALSQPLRCIECKLRH